MKTLLRSLFFILALIFLTACGGGGGDSSSPTTVTAPLVSEQTQYFLEKSTSKDENTLLYSKQISLFVDDVSLLQTLILDNQNGLEELTNSYETAISMLYDPLYTNLSDEDKLVVKNYYKLISSKLEENQELLIIQLNKLLIDEVNINTFAVNSPSASSSSSLRVAPLLPQKIPSLGFFKLITNIGVATHRLITGARAKNDPLIREALSTQNSVEGTKTLFSKLNIPYGADADGEALYNIYKNLNASNQRDVDNSLTNMSIEVWEDSAAHGGKYADVDLFDAKKRSNDSIVPLFKRTVTDVGNIVVDTYGLQTPNLKVINDYKDALTVYKNIKTLTTPTKPYKVIVASKKKTSTVVTQATTSYSDAKKTINTLNNIDGYKNTKLLDLENATLSYTNEQAKNDNDGDNSNLSASSSVATMSVIPTVTSTSDTQSQLSIDLKIPSDFDDENLSIDIVSVDENQSLKDGNLPEDIVINTFDDIKQSDFTIAPLVIVDITNNETLLSKAIIAEDDDSVTYRVTANLTTIYKLGSSYLDIDDGSALMGNTEQAITNTSTHIQTFTWDVDVIGSFAMMKLTRTDDESFSEYIQLDGKSTTPTISESTFKGRSNFTDDDNVVWITDVTITFKSNNVLTGSISGTAADDTQSGITSGTLTGTWGNGSFLATGNIQLCSSAGAGCGALLGTIYRGEILNMDDNNINIRLEDREGFVFDSFVAQKQ